MRRTPFFYLPVLCASALACAVAPRVEVDRLEGADLARHESFSLDEARAVEDDPAFGPTARAAAREALVAELRARGLQPVDARDEADLWVAISVTSRTRLEGGDVFVSPGHPHVVTRRTGLRTPVGDVPLREDRAVVHHGGTLHAGPSYEVTERVLVVDVYEARSEKLVWRGTARGPRGREIDPDDLRRRVRAIASEFP